MTIGIKHSVRRYRRPAMTKPIRKAIASECKGASRTSRAIVSSGKPYGDRGRSVAVDDLNAFGSFGVFRFPLQFPLSLMIELLIPALRFSSLLPKFVRAVEGWPVCESRSKHKISHGLQLFQNSHLQCT
jgi:hypothetical protein